MGRNQCHLLCRWFFTLSIWLDDTQTWAEHALLSCFQHAFPPKRIYQCLIPLIRPVSVNLSSPENSWYGWLWACTLAVSSASSMARLIGELFHELFMLMVVPWTQQENKNGLWQDLRLFTVDGTSEISSFCCLIWRCVQGGNHSYPAMKEKTAQRKGRSNYKNLYPLRSKHLKGMVLRYWGFYVVGLLKQDTVSLEMLDMLHIFYSLF